MSGITDAGLLVGASILNLHPSYSLQQVIGVIESARVERTQLACRGRLWDHGDPSETIYRGTRATSTNIHASLRARSKSVMGCFFRVGTVDTHSGIASSAAYWRSEGAHPSAGATGRSHALLR